VFASLRRIAAESGKDAATRKRAQMVSLLRAARGPEPRFLIRTLLANMRIGASRATVLSCIAAASCYHRAASASAAAPPSKSELDAAAASVARAYSVCPSFDVLIPALLAHGAAALTEHCALTPGVPVNPMLAKPTGGIPDALNALRAAGSTEGAEGLSFLAEFKYDGQRAQCHILPPHAAGADADADVSGADASPRVRIFSRNGDDVSAAFPDAAAALLAAAAGGVALTAGGAVLDAELVAVDRADGNRVRPFQDLSTRARSAAGAAAGAAAVPVDVCLFVFDCLALGGRALIDEPLSARRAAIDAALPSLHTLPPGRVARARGQELQLPSHTDADADADADADVDADADDAQLITRVTALLHASLAGGCEGLMLKRLDARYDPDKRSSAWLKLKKDYIAELQDSLDLVPIGAWRGSGRKHAWYSPFLLACYDPETETYASVCRVMSGFSDAFYKDRFAFYHEGDGSDDSDVRELPGKPAYYATGDTPDVWLAPREVWEVRGADLTLSPRHAAAAGRVHATRGVSLRFPRFIRVRCVPNDAHAHACMLRAALHACMRACAVCVKF
jgi:DNA ligase-1